MNREQKYRYCLFDGKARLHFLCVLCYVGWIRVINCELCESKQVLHAIFKEILHSLTWTVLFSVLGFCTVFVGGLVFGYQRCGIYYLCDLERPSSPGANLEYLTEKKKHETDEFFRNAHQQNTNPRRSASQKSDPNYIAVFTLKFEENCQGNFSVNWQPVGITCIASLCFILCIRF